MNRLKIFCSPNFSPEKQYIIDTLIGEFLGLSYSIEIANNSESIYKIVLPNKSEIIFADSFFSNFDETSGYVKKEAVPENPKFLVTDYCSEKNLPFLFGNEEFKIEESNKRITCGADIFASAFFFITRWEEKAIQKRDEHGRFPCKVSFVQKNNLELRAVVNEYVEFLWNLLQELSLKGKRKIRKYQVIPTHDIDFFRRFDTFKKRTKMLLHNLYVNKNRKLFVQRYKYLQNVRKGLIQDPFDTFDYFMDQSEEFGYTSEFYFIPAKKGDGDFRYSILDESVISSIENIINRGHKVGMHASYNVYNKPEVFRAEYKRLKQIHSQINIERHHYLRFEVPESWQVIADCGISKSSNIGFTNKIGFRSSCCYSHKVFNIDTRKTLELVEQALVMMDSALFKGKPNHDEFFANAIEVSKTVKKYNGEFVFLWHNSNFNLPEWKELASRYSWFLESVK